MNPDSSHTLRLNLGDMKSPLGEIQSEVYAGQTVDRMLRVKYAQAPSLLSDPDSLESMCWSFGLPTAIFQPQPEQSVVAQSSDVGVVGQASMRRRFLEASAVVGEISGASGFLRYGGFLSILERTGGNLPLSTAYLAASTFFLEGLSAESMPNILARHNESPSKIVNKCSSMLEKLGAPKKLSKMSTAILTYYGGVAPYQYSKWREDPNVLTQELRHKGRIATLGLTAISTLQGAILGNAIKEYDDPKVAVPTVLLAIGAAAGGRKIKNRVFKREK